MTPAVELSFCSDDETLNTKERSVLKCPLQKKQGEANPRTRVPSEMVLAQTLFLLDWYSCWSGFIGCAILGLSCLCNQTTHHNIGKQKLRGQVYHDLNLSFTWSVVPRVGCLTQSVLLRVSLQECPRKNVSLSVFYHKGRTMFFW